MATSVLTRPRGLWFRGSDEQKKTATVTGRHGLIGGAIAARLGDVTSFPIRDTRVIFHFGSYSHVQFEENPNYHIKRGLDEFTELLQWGETHETLLVFPSSALVYEKDTPFARFKKTLESLASCYEKARTLCLRIFPVYGPSERRTFISKSCDAMKAGNRPIVYGDGTQARDFIFIDDVVDQILAAVDDCQWKQSATVDIGTGTLKTFNGIIDTINAQLGTSIEPQYIRPPFGYSAGIACQNPGEVKVSMEEGVRRIIGSCGQLDRDP